MIKDTFHREHNYLRISLTDVCNLRCFYCMPEESYDFTPKVHIMRADEIEVIAKTFVDLGVSKIRLTGGEPMARKDFGNILLRLAKLPVELNITTNATLLDTYLTVLKEAHVKTLNISLDTLSAEKFKYLTRRDKFTLTMNNIRKAIQKGFRVKINMVVMKGFNDMEILDFIAWTQQDPVEVRFIEFMPFSGNRWTSNQVTSWKEILTMVEEHYAVIPLRGDVHDTAKKYALSGYESFFSIISTMSAPFCAGCNRMRLTADGKMKNCLFSKGETDLLSALRNGEPIRELILRNILGKAEKLGGQFDANFKELKSEDIENRSMISIGG
ncbi:GTP 3',8-cyclase MoaA [Olivibacter sp. SDN3]|uniref:GTP 3',8-cyclase MoaA n=1 Tax=Olivibacter sp. SDN3 TaxID=2764720 RepID=UPI0016513F81|nr:GTP 3',8-cyclase MoaA [Olivibacter sp. SDN3]QNL50160.1 GTP 3',8-cyclase MoaA [Olivibacter sp. SDN3]